MTRKTKPDFIQMNLALCRDEPAEFPKDKQRELALALADLLIHALTRTGIKRGADNESETHG